MNILPAVDILEGRAVRLAKGRYDAVTVYNEDPVLQAQLFEEAGAQWLHVVDLDGAKSGNPDNSEVVRAILKATNLKVEVGGGVRTRDAIERLLDAGATRVVLGTALVRDPDFAQASIEHYGEALAAGIDAKEGEVAVAGWCEGSGKAATEVASAMAALGYRHLIYTDIARDGMQTGIDPVAYKAMAEAFGYPVIASGGVASLQDIEALKELGDLIEGVIAGRAIYEGAFSVADAIACARSTYDVDATVLSDEMKPLYADGQEA